LAKQVLKRDKWLRSFSIFVNFWPKKFFKKSHGINQLWSSNYQYSECVCILAL